MKKKKVISELKPDIIKCVHCGIYFEDKDSFIGKVTHQSGYCPKCRQNHFGNEIIEDEN